MTFDMEAIWQTGEHQCGPTRGGTLLTQGSGKMEVMRSLERMLIAGEPGLVHLRLQRVGGLRLGVQV
jgi:hypothetical protein